MCWDDACDVVYTHTGLSLLGFPPSIAHQAGHCPPRNLARHMFTFLGIYGRLGSGAKAVRCWTEALVDEANTILSKLGLHWDVLPLSSLTSLTT